MIHIDAWVRPGTKCTVAPCRMAARYRIVYPVKPAHDKFSGGVQTRFYCPTHAGKFAERRNLELPEG